MKRITFSAVLYLMTLMISGCKGNTDQNHPIYKSMEQHPAVTDTATFGAGCFWCTEAQFQLLNGIISVTSGYSGGNVKNPSYREVCTGRTGHAEVSQIVYDTSKISYEELLEAFWKAHDPTQLNRQGNDTGTQYRSVIFYHNEKQRLLAEQYKKLLDASGAFDAPIVTEIVPFTAFYKAEDYHQNYFNENGEQPYCRFVVAPKVEKFKKVFKGKLKDEIENQNR
ncbi:MAG: peptide-methionine (S)-S-oxide reductase MsrA [Bacteroidia bacterium]|nr:peptide-methionine (S)-S-oxide reductase MsrA [Bacteroidia bacterium]